MLKSSITKYILLSIIILMNIGCDQVTKDMAVDQLMGAPQSFYLNDMFILTFVENDGAFLSLGSNMHPTLQFILLKALPVVMLLLLTAYTFASKSLNKYQALGLSFILGGGISNIYDRLLYGKVVDFMNMGIGDLRTGIFNFADVSIMIGIGIFLVSNFFVKNKKEENPLSDESSDQQVEKQLDT